MRLLLDTHIALAMANEEAGRLSKPLRDVVDDASTALAVSVISFWEIAIKHRQGRLPLPYPLEDWPIAMSILGVAFLDLRSEHVIALADPVPDTKDPFDRMLLAICAAEKLRLVTIDRALLDHPLAYRAG